MKSNELLVCMIALSAFLIFHGHSTKQNRSDQDEKIMALQDVVVTRTASGLADLES